MERRLSESDVGVSAYEEGIEALVALRAMGSATPRRRRSLCALVDALPM